MTGPRIAFVGTGAQGAGIAADLTRAGLDVTWIEQWPAHVDAMRENGIEVRLPEGTVTTTGLKVLHLCQVAELRDDFDIVYLVVKAYDTRWAVELIKPRLAADGVIVGVQNGMSIEDIASIVGRDRTVGAVIEMASNMFEPGIVTRQNMQSGTWFAVGGLNEVSQERAVAAQQALSHAGTVELSDDIRSSKWMKLVANAGELVPSAILDETLYDAVRMPGVHEFMIECGKEAARAAVADGSKLKAIFGLREDQVTEPDQYAADLLGEVLDKYALPDTRTTVLHDWIKGRHSEFAEINGLVVDVLTAAGEPAPYNAHVIELARRIEAGALERGPQNLALLLDVPVTIR